MASTTEPHVVLRMPSPYTSNAEPATPAVRLPAPEDLEGRWYTTHATLPFWKDKRNVTVDYKMLTATTIDNLSTYQAVSSSKLETLHGTDSVLSPELGRYQWRGNGWLKVASCRWEIIGSGFLAGDGGDRWMVTYAQKSMFTPLGLTVSTTRKGGLSPDWTLAIKKALIETTRDPSGVDVEQWMTLIDSLYAVSKD